MALNLDLDALTAQERYKLLKAVVVPRPTAWVATVNVNVIENAAPYFFNMFGQDSANVILGLEHRVDGMAKDAERNLDATDEFVVNIVIPDLLEGMVGSAAVYASDEGEPEALGLKLAPSAKVTPPRLADAPVATECVRMFALSLSSERSIMLVCAVGLAARDGLIDAKKYVDWVDDYPVARLFAYQIGAT